MLNDTQQFITEYEQWSKQEKYQKFDSISNSLPEKWKRRLLGYRIFSLPATLFGPFYLMFLGGAFSGLFTLLLQALLSFLIFGFTANTSAFIAAVTVMLLILSVNLMCCLYVNKLYIKNRLAFKKKMQDFDPDAQIEWFNISATRLIMLTVLTGGGYLVYWFYRQSKAIKTAQKDNSFAPFADGLFCYLCSIHVFKRIAVVLDNPKQLKPKASAWELFLLPLVGTSLLKVITIVFIIGSGMVSANMGIQELIKVQLVGGTIEILGFFLIIFSITYIVNKYRLAIELYCQQKQIPQTHKFTFWEIILLIIGIIGMADTFIGLFFHLVGWINFDLFAQFVLGMLEK